MGENYRERPNGRCGGQQKPSYPELQKEREHVGEEKISQCFITMITLKRPRGGEKGCVHVS
jgi:hypothetical protein